MKLFGWKSAGRAVARPALSRGFASWVAGEFPRSYEDRVRDAYLGNPVAQRAVRMVAEGVYQSDRPCVIDAQAGTNDLGTTGLSGAQVYARHAAAFARLVKSKGFYVVGRTIIERSDGLWSGAKETERLAYNNLLVANASGAFDSVIDARGDAQIGDGSGYKTDIARAPDGLHPSDTTQGYIGLSVLKPAYQTILAASPRASRAVNALFLSAPGYADAKYGLGLNAGGGFIDMPIIPPALTFPMTVECWIRTSTAASQAVVGKLNVSGTLPYDFYLGLNASGKAFASTDASTGNMTSGVTVSDGADHFLRLVLTATGAKLEVDGGAVVTTATAARTDGTRAGKFRTMDGAFAAGGIGDFTGILSGLAIFGSDRSGAGVPSGHIAMGTANLRGYYPLEGHVEGWN